MEISRSAGALRAGVLAATATAISLLCLPAVAQQDESMVIFEEIVVVAQKRQQNIMEVPVAVSAVSGQQIENAGIKDIFDLQQNVPNLIIGRSQTATTTNFSIRGIGSTSNNFGVESSVGLYVDGVYRSRQSSLINELIDVQSVEVLRGPQGTLFGKNTPAGAVQVLTVAPGQDRNAFIDLTAGEFGLVRLSAASNFPINDNLALRATVFSSQRDGYVDDINLGNDLYNDRDRFGARLQALYEPSDDLSVRVIADYNEIDETCCATVTLVDGLLSRTFFEPGSDAALLQIGAQAGLDPVFFTDYWAQAVLADGFGPLVDNIVFNSGSDDYVTAYNFAPESKNEDSGLSVEINKNFDNGMTLTSITAFRSFDTFDNIDGDFTNIPIVERINDADLDSFSQELRLAGSFGSGGNYVVGAYYFGQEIDQVTITNDDTAGTPFIETYLSLNSDIQDLLTGINTVAGTVINADPLVTLADLGYPTAGNPFPLGATSRDDILQDQDGWAVFGQIDFPLGDDFILTLGARYTDETKDIDATYTQNVPFTDPAPNLNALAVQLCAATSCVEGLPAFTPVIPDAQSPFGVSANPEVLAIFAPFAADGWGSYGVPPISPRPDLDDSLTDDQTTGTAKLSWFPNDRSLVYLSWATGFKSGGTNTERISPAFDPIFQAETSESIEIGYKGDVGPFRLALTAYDATFDDFQAQTFTGTGFNLQNAGQIDSQGVELEVLWRPFDGTDVQLIYTHNEAEYAAFRNGTCWDGYTFHTGIPDPGLPDNLTALDPEVCDKTGNPIAYNPEDRLFVSFSQSIELTNSMGAFVRVEYSQASEQFTDGDLDPYTEQDTFSITNARVGLDFYDWNASLTFWGRNITDERYFVGSFDAPIQVGRMNSYPAEPATWGATFRKNFD